MRDTISFLIPCFNEEECVPVIVQRIQDVVSGLKVNFEIIFIDDGSNDGTLDAIKRLRENNVRIKLLAFSRNFGHQISVKAGLNYVSGDCAVIMDSDLQDPPDLVPQMLERWHDGVKVVYAIRRNRQENIIKRSCYNLFYYLLNKLSPIKIPRDAGDFCLMDRQVIDEINRIEEYKPFVRGLRAWVGFRQEGIEYNRPARYAGETGYSYTNLFKLALDGFMSCSDVFLVWSSIIGVFISCVSMMYGGWIAIHSILIMTGVVTAKNFIPGWASIICLMAFLLGLQFIFLGLLGKYIGRIFMHTKNRPLYIIQETAGLNK